MFTHLVDLPFATEQAPAPLRGAFGELLVLVEPITAEGEEARGASAERCGERP